MIKKICYLLLLSACLLSLVACGNSSKDNGEQTNEANVDLDKLPTNDKVEQKPNFDIDINSNNSTELVLDTLSTTTLTLTKSGTYILTGKFKGNIVVEGDADEIIIVLKNANITTLDNQPYPAITFKKHNGTRILHIFEGTTNSLSDSIGDTNEANEGNSVIQSKKSSLQITGSGTLNITSFGEETTGIKVKNDLSISDTTININVNDNGIKAGATLAIYDASINVNADNDAIKTDIEATNTTEGNEYTTNPFAGYIYIKNSNITINCGDNGISANSLLKIDNTIDHTIDVTTNNGAPSTITEMSSDNADGKAIRTAGITLVDEATGEETDLPSKTTDNYLLIILGGKFIINSNDDAITSKGNLYINGGEYQISTGDDALHAEYLTTIYNGNFNIGKCYEGIEGASVEIYNGNINLISSDDGINAANSDLKNYSYNIYLGGGTILIDAAGDGIDSNGTLEITGGNITIWGPIKNDNAALDAERGILINGGTLIACGPSGMIETPANNSDQCSIVYSIPTNISVGSEIIVKDSTDKVLYSTQVKKQCQSIIISLPEFKLNQTYTIIVGTNSQSINLNSTTTIIGSTMVPGGSGMTPGGRPSGTPPTGEPGDTPPTGRPGGTPPTF